MRAKTHISIHTLLSLRQLSRIWPCLSEFRIMTLWNFKGHLVSSLDRLTNTRQGNTRARKALIHPSTRRNLNPRSQCSRKLWSSCSSVYIYIYIHTHTNIYVYDTAYGPICSINSACIPLPVQLRRLRLKYLGQGRTGHLANARRAGRVFIKRLRIFWKIVGIIWNIFFLWC
jgi:hypothetical protein